MNDVLRHIRHAALLRDGGGQTDGQLLECFLASRDEAAFAALVRRYGPMVLGVCRRVLGNHHDAEDAFQATFLVLARKAASVRALGSWLHGVAFRTALRARTMTARRREHEQRAREMARPGATEDDPWQELLPRLDQELGRLPEHYRAAVVLCDLEGLTRREAAHRLGVPEGTVSGRLTTARRLLARRLARYGLAVSGGVLVASLSEREASACVTCALASSTARAAALGVGGRALTAGAVPAQVAALTEGVMRTMLLTKLKTFVVVAFALLVSVGAVGLTYRPGVAQSPQKPERPIADELEELRLEVAALRKGLDATRQRVKVLEAEAQARKVGTTAAPGGANVDLFRPLEDLFREQRDLEAIKRLKSARLERARQMENVDHLTEAEAALKNLRKDPGDKQAADALEKALRQLKEERLKEKPDAGKKP